MSGGIEDEVELDATAPTPHQRPASVHVVVVGDAASPFDRFRPALSPCFEVTAADDLDEVLVVAPAERPDIVVVTVRGKDSDALDRVAKLKQRRSWASVPLVVAIVDDDPQAVAAALSRGCDEVVAASSDPVEARARVAAAMNRSDRWRAELAWTQSLTGSISEGIVALAGDGTVLEVNRAFLDMIGVADESGGWKMPHPWWPSAEESADELTHLSTLPDMIRAGAAAEFESTFYRADRTSLDVRLNLHPGGGDRSEGGNISVLVVRDISAERSARLRRATAAEISKDLTTADELAEVLTIAENGFAALFDGGSTVKVTLNGDERIFYRGRLTPIDELPAHVGTGLAGKPHSDTRVLRNGILLIPQGKHEVCRAWIDFPRPRRVSADELIVADLLAQTLAIAVDRVSLAQWAADREAHLRAAIDSHGLIGQATGVLVERHRVTPAVAFARLRQASQNRNIRLRDLAERVVSTGSDPERA